MDWNQKKTYEKPGVVIFEYILDGQRRFSAWDKSINVMNMIAQLSQSGAENVTYTRY